MVRVGVLVAVALAGGCLGADVSRCASGHTCPAGLVCFDDQCVTAEQIESCAELAEGDRCFLRESPEALCLGRLCQAVGCGNAKLDPGEICDDGNVTPFDGCSDTCDTVCRDGTLDDGELCDGPENPPLEECVDFGFDVGPLECTDACGVAFSACRRFDVDLRPLGVLEALTDLFAIDDRAYVTGSLRFDPVEDVPALYSYADGVWTKEFPLGDGDFAINGVSMYRPHQRWQRHR